MFTWPVTWHGWKIAYGRKITSTSANGPDFAICSGYCSIQMEPETGCIYVCILRQGSSLLCTNTLRPFYSRPIALTQEGRSLVNDVCECVRD